MSWLKKLFRRKCVRCHKELYFSPFAGSEIGVYFGSEAEEYIMKRDRTAFKCDKCGALLCMACAYAPLMRVIGSCPKCGGNAFHRAVE